MLLNEFLCFFVSLVVSHYIYLKTIFDVLYLFHSLGMLATSTLKFERVCLYQMMVKYVFYV